MNGARLILGTCIVLPPVLLACLGTFHTWSHESESTNSEAMVESLQSEIADLRHCARECDRLQKAQKSGIEQIGSALSDLVGPVSAPPRFLPLFDRLAGACGVKVLTCRWSKAGPRPAPGPRADPSVGTSNTSSYATVSFFVTVQGSADGILALIGALEANPRPIAIAAVDIKRKDRPRLPLEARLHALVAVRAGPS